MRIGINTLFENPMTGTGGLTYLRNLIPALSRLDSENEYVLFVSPMNRKLFQGLGPNFSLVECPFSKERRVATVLFEHSRLPFLIRRHRIDVFHSPGNIAPICVPCASVVTVHTMHHYVVPDMMARSSRIYRKTFLPLTTKRADCIIAISDWVRDFLVTRLQAQPEKVIRVYEGVELPSHVRDGREESVFAERYILFVSALWPYKNAHNLIQAMSILRRKHGDSHNLVIVGSGWSSYREKLECLTDEVGLSGSIRFAGRVSDVFAYYRRAVLFAYPSLHEEFGLPLLEAMACGTPVVAAKRGSLPEVAGDAALLVDPEQPEEIATAIHRVLSDRILRQDLIRRGVRRAAGFTWEKTAEGTLVAYRYGLDRWRARSCHRATSRTDAEVGPVEANVPRMGHLSKHDCGDGGDCSSYGSGGR